jgi:hypothetical protein
VKPAFYLLGQCVGICFEGSYFGSKQQVLLAKSSLSAVGSPSLSTCRYEKLSSPEILGYRSLTPLRAPLRGRAAGNNLTLRSLWAQSCARGMESQHRIRVVEGFRGEISGLV